MAATSSTSPNSPSMAPDEIRNARFSTGFRGYDTAEVRAFLARVAGSYGELSARVFDIDRVTVVSTADEGAVASEAEHGESESADEQFDDAVDAEAEIAAVVAATRSQIAEMVAAARNESTAIVSKANDEAVRIILRARAESRGKPSGDAIAVVEAAFADSPSDPLLAKEQARLMIAEARAVRERILTDLAKRRKVAHVQLEQLRVAKEKLQESLREARRVVDDAARDLGTAEIEARLAAETAGRRVAAEVEPTGAELESELFGAGSVLRLRAGSPLAAAAAAAAAVSDVTETAEAVDDMASEAVTDVEDDGAPSAPADPAEIATKTKRSSKNVDELFARLRADRQEPTVAAREVLDAAPDGGEGGGSGKSRKVPAEKKKSDDDASRRKPAKAAAKRSNSSAGLMSANDARGTDTAVLDDVDVDVNADVGIIDLSSFPSAPLDLRSLIGAEEAEDEPLSAGRTEFITGTLQGQLVRALRRYLLDEQSSTLAALRTARGRVQLNELLGAEDTHRERIIGAVRPFFVNAYRAGADPSKAGGDDFVIEVVRPFAGNLADAIGSSIRTELAVSVDAASTPESDRLQLVEAIGSCYRAWTTDRMNLLSQDQLLACFGLGRER